MSKNNSTRVYTKRTPHSRTHNIILAKRTLVFVLKFKLTHKKKLYQHLHKRCLNHLKWVYNNVLWSMDTSNRSLPTFKTHFLKKKKKKKKKLQLIKQHPICSIQLLQHALLQPAGAMFFREVASKLSKHKKHRVEHNKVSTKITIHAMMLEKTIKVQNRLHHELRQKAQPGYHQKILQDLPNPAVCEKKKKKNTLVHLHAYVLEPHTHTHTHTHTRIPRLVWATVAFKVK